MVRCGAVWCGVAWRGVAWRGVACKVGWCCVWCGRVVWCRVMFCDRLVMVRNSDICTYAHDFVFIYYHYDQRHLHFVQLLFFQIIPFG